MEDRSRQNDVNTGEPLAVTVADDSGPKRAAGHAKSKHLPADVGSGALQIAPGNIISLLERAVDKKAGIEVLERLMALQTQAQQQMARQSFFDALRSFQSKCPMIRKTRLVREKGGGKVRYKFASLDDIVAQVGPLVARHGFSYLWKPHQQDVGKVKAAIEVHHVAGHMESSEFDVPIESSAYMNDQQRVASALTFAKRYAFCAAFGIMTGDTDDDGQGAGVVSENGAGAKPVQQKPPQGLPEDAGAADLEKLLKQMTWMPEDTKAMYRKQTQHYVDKGDAKSLRGMLTALTKQIAYKEGEKK